MSCREQEQNESAPTSWQGTQGWLPSLVPSSARIVVKQYLEWNIPKKLHQQLERKPKEKWDVCPSVSSVTFHVSRAIQDSPPWELVPLKRDRTNHSRISHSCRWPWSWRFPTWLWGRPESPSSSAVLTFSRWERHHNCLRSGTHPFSYMSRENLCHLNSSSISHPMQTFKIQMFIPWS